MENFNFNLSTKIAFGKDSVDKLPSLLEGYGKKILLAYGMSSIKKIGLYDKVLDLLGGMGVEVFELSGITPNPRLDKVIEGAKICRENDIDFILAVGGGSTIDCAKAIAMQAKYEGSVWEDFYTNHNYKLLKEALPIGSILTLSATGSEMNGGTVISNVETEEKFGFGHPLLKPKFSILDPQLTFSVSKYQTASGSADILSHLFEQYFNPSKSGYLQSRIAEGIMKTVIEFGPKAVEDGEDYEARANLMWASSLALNGLVNLGKPGDWSVHAMEHELSAKYDIAHGVGLAILTPHWMRYVKSSDNKYRFVEMAQNVFGIYMDEEEEMVEACIKRWAEFFESIGIPKNLRELGIDESRLEEMAGACTKNGKIGSMKSLGKDDVLAIYKASL